MKDVKSSKKNTLTDGLIEKTSSMIDAAASKTVQGFLLSRRGKRRKALSEVKPLENKNKNQQSFLEACRVQKEVFFHINCETIHMSIRIFRIKGRYPRTEKLPESMKSFKIKLT